MAIHSCAADGCDLPIYTHKGDPRGACRHHHVLWRRFGTVDVGYWDMFLEFVDVQGPDDCWPWLGACNKPDDDPTRYGVYWTIAHATGCSPYVHRIAYEHEHGDIGDGLEIDHTCHQRLCVNPRHLRKATSAQNKENRQGAMTNSVTGVLGVIELRRKGIWTGRYKAQVCQGGKTIYCGTYDTVEEAGEAAKAKRLELFSHNAIDRRAD